MKYLIAIVFACQAIGCAASSQVYQIRDGGGKNWIGIHCSNHLECLARAGEECPNGYTKSEDSRERFSQESYVGPKTGIAAAIANGLNGTAAGMAGQQYTPSVHAWSGEVYKEDIMIQCAGKSRAEIEADSNVLAPLGGDQTGQSRGMPSFGH